MSDVLSVYTYRLSCLFFFFFFFSLRGRSLSPPPPAKKSGARSGASSKATTTDGMDEGTSRSSHSRQCFFFFSEYNTCHQVQVGNPSTRTLVPRSTVLVPFRFQVELTSSWVNLCWSGVTVAMTVTQATSQRGNALFLSPPWAPCEVQVQFTIPNQRRQPGHLSEIYITAKTALNGIVSMLWTWSNERSGGSLCRIQIWAVEVSYRPRNQAKSHSSSTRKLSPSLYLHFPLEWLITIT